MLRKQIILDIEIASFFQNAAATVNEINFWCDSFDSPSGYHRTGQYAHALWGGTEERNPRACEAPSYRRSRHGERGRENHSLGQIADAYGCQLLTSTKWPSSAAAAAMIGETRCVRPL
jgi:hypothetical protein